MRNVYKLIFPFQFHGSLCKLIKCFWALNYSSNFSNCQNLEVNSHKTFLLICRGKFHGDLFLHGRLACEQPYLKTEIALIWRRCFDADFVALTFRSCRFCVKMFRRQVLDAEIFLRRDVFPPINRF